MFWQDDVDAEMRQIELSERDAEGSLRELLTQWRPSLLVTTTLAVFQQLTGQTNVLNYTAEIFRASGFAAIAAPAVWLGSIKVIFTIVAIAYVSRLAHMCRFFLQTANKSRDFEPMLKKCRSPPTQRMKA